jgi:preprotein translocase subunit SecE
MNAKADQASGNSGGDIAKLVVASILVLGGLFAFYWFGTAPQLTRTLGLVAALAAGGALAAFTHTGRRVRHFLSESHFELRKVVWPTRDETIKTTLIIAVVVVILSLLLGLIDLILKSVVLEWLLKLGQ